MAAVIAMNAVNNVNGAGSSTNGRSSVSLRGQSGKRTLVLVNGRRLAEAIGGLVGGSVNVSNIPLAAIESLPSSTSWSGAVRCRSPETGDVHW
jgi:outer membrane receptor for ferrienterochelin and colicin